MEKIINFLRNIYNTENKIMLYVYIAIAVVTIILILTIIINWIVTSSKRKKLNKQITPVVINIDPIENEEKTEEVKVDVEEITKDISPIINTKEITPIEEIKNYDRPLEENVVFEEEVKVRTSAATDLLDEFLIDNNIGNNFGITADELNSPLPENFVDNQSEPIYSTVFLDKKESELEKREPEVNLILTPIIPETIENIIPEKTIDELFEKENIIAEPDVIKPTLDEVLAKMKANNETINEETLEEPKEETPEFTHEIEEVIIENIKEELLEKPKEEPQVILEIKEEPQVILEIKDNKEDNTVKEIVVQEEPHIEEEHDKSLDTMVDIFSHEAIKQAEAPVETKSERVVFTAADLKNRLEFLKTKTTEEEFDKEYDDIFKQIGLDESLEKSDKESLDTELTLGK